MLDSISLINFAFFFAVVRFAAKYGRLPRVENIITVSSSLEYLCLDAPCFCEDLAQMVYDELLTYGFAPKLSVSRGKYVYKVYPIRF